MKSIFTYLFVFFTFFVTSANASGVDNNGIDFHSESKIEKETSLQHSQNAIGLTDNYAVEKFALEIEETEEEKVIKTKLPLTKVFIRSINFKFSPRVSKVDSFYFSKSFVSSTPRIILYSVFRI